MPPWVYWLIFFLVFLGILICIYTSAAAYSLLKDKMVTDQLLGAASDYIWSASLLLLFVSLAIFIGAIIYIYATYSHNQYFMHHYKVFTGIISFLIITLLVITGILAIIASTFLASTVNFSPENNDLDRSIQMDVTLTYTIALFLSIMLFIFYITYVSTVSIEDYFLQ